MGLFRKRRGEVAVVRDRDVPVVRDSGVTVGEYRGRHGNAEVEVRQERRVRETHHKDYDEYETHEVKHARAKVWREREG